MSKTVKAKRKIKAWVILLIIFGAIIVVAAGGLLADAPGRIEIQALVIHDVDFKNLRDGTYVGEYAGTKGHNRDTKIEVTISGGKITDTKILKGALDGNGNAAEMTEGMTMDDLFQKVLQSQSLQVDAISGATLTSKAHLKALEECSKEE